MFKAIGNKIIINHKDDSVRKSIGGYDLSIVNLGEYCND